MIKTFKVDTFIDLSTALLPNAVKELYDLLGTPYISEIDKDSYYELDKVIGYFEFDYSKSEAHFIDGSTQWMRYRGTNRVSRVIDNYITEGYIKIEEIEQLWPLGHKQIQVVWLIQKNGVKLPAKTYALVELIKEGNSSQFNLINMKNYHVPKISYFVDCVLEDTLGEFYCVKKVKDENIIIGPGNKLEMFDALYY